MKTLRRSRTNRMLAGVCGGIAEYIGADPTVVRLVFALVSMMMGTGVLAYIVATILMPEEVGEVI